MTETDGMGISELIHEKKYIRTCNAPITKQQNSSETNRDLRHEFEQTLPIKF